MKRLLAAPALTLLAFIQCRAPMCAAAPAPENDLKVPKDWKAQVVAQPPELVFPSVVEVAPDGRIFVAEDPMDMVGPTTKPGDRILCIFPDGHKTVFADHLNAVFGLRYLDGKLYVHHTPEYSVFVDDNGIGKDRKDIFTKDTLHAGDNNLNDHIPSNIRLAMDNYFYITTGDKGYFHAKSTVDGKEVTIHGGGIIRIRPDGTDNEVYCTGTRNHLDVAINDEDEMFTYDNTDDGLGWNTRYSHMVDGGWYGYPFDYLPQRPYTLWMMYDFGGGSPTGSVGYNEDYLPEEYRGNLFHCEWGKGHFARVTVEREGATYKIGKYEPFLTGSNLRPLGVSILPDGSGFLMTDWQMGGWGSPKPQGRLIKISYTGKSHATPWPDWYIPAAEGRTFSASLEDLIKGLSHPAESVRLVAQRRIAERGAEAIKPLAALLNDATAPAYARWHAIWTLDLLDAGKAGRPAILAILKDNQADITVRRQAARELGIRRAAEATDALLPLLDSSDAPMRFRAATALGRIGNPAAIAPLLNHLEEKDFFTRYAIFTALNRIGRADSSAWLAIIKGLASDKSGVREGTGFAVRETFDKTLVDALSAIVADNGISSTTRAAALAALAPLHRKQPAWDGSWWGTQPARNPAPAKTVEWEGTTTVLSAIRAGLTSENAQVRQAAIGAMQIAPDPAAGDALAALFPRENDPQIRRKILLALGASKSPAGTKLILSILNSPAENAPLVSDAVDAAQQIGSSEMSDALAHLAGTPNASADQLAAAFAALAKLRAAAGVPVMQKQIGNANDRVAIAAAEALGAVGGARAGAALQAGLADPRPQVRRAVVKALGTAQNRNAIPDLVKAYQNEQTREQAIAALARMPDAQAIDAYLDGLGGQNAGVRDQCRRAVQQLGYESLPLVEARLGHFPISPAAIRELQRIYTRPEPLHQWMLVGPFSKAVDVPFDVSQPPVAGASFKGEGGKAVQWQKSNRISRDGFVDLFAIMSPNENVTAFAATTITSKEDREVEIQADSDDGFALWLNGQKIFEDLQDHGWNADAYHLKGHLKQGKNLLVAEITQHAGPWGFSVAVAGAQHGKLWDYKPADNGPEAYEKYAMDHNGKPADGRAIFQNVNGVGCIKCHSVGGQGGQVGPSLDSIGTKYTRAQILESVLYPSKQIAAGYEQTMVRTKDGQVFSGVIRQETADQITMYDSTANKIVIRKSDVDVRKASNVSVMPEGLQTGLTPPQFADLISYLQSLKEASPQTPGK